MNAGNYELLVRDLCAQYGHPDPHGVIESRHLEFDGLLVGLIPGQDEQLHVFVEVACGDPAHDTTLYRQLLEFNACKPEHLAGWFGLHPLGRGIAYCLRWPAWAPGDALGSLLAEQIPLARQAYRQACLPA